MKTKSFYARVEFTDERGTHPAGSIVNLPYESDRHIADALSMIAYGVVSEQAPENRPAPAPQQQEEQTLPEVEPGPMVYPTADDPQTPYYDARHEDGSFASEEEVENTQEVETHDHSVSSAGDEEPKDEEPKDEEPKDEEPKKASRRKR